MHRCLEILLPAPLCPCPVLQTAARSLGEQGLGLPRTACLSWSYQADLCAATGLQDPCQTSAHMAYLYVMLTGFLLLSRGAVAFVLDHFTVGFCPLACLPKPSWLPLCLSKCLWQFVLSPPTRASPRHTESLRPKHMLHSPEVVFKKYLYVFNRSKLFCGSGPQPEDLC